MDLILLFCDHVEMTVEELYEHSRFLNSIYLCPESEISAKVAADCTTRLAIEIGEGRLSNGFAIVRPPGHHAEPDKVRKTILIHSVKKINC